MQSYTMNGNKNISDIAVQAVVYYLNADPWCVRVESVEKDREWQKVDVDLLAYYTAPPPLDEVVSKIEVKGDNYHKSGNFFFEYKSNIQKDTPGCFMYTACDWLYYVFPVIKTMYKIRMPETREWFLENIGQFRVRETSTKKHNGDILYTSSGYLVPIKSVPAELMEKIVYE